MPDGITDNTILLSNLFNAGGTVYIPPGTYAHGSILVNLTSPPVTIYGDGDSSRLMFTGSVNSFGLTFLPPSCVIRRVNLTQSGAGSAPAFAANGGAISLNAVGYSSVDACSFYGLAGNCIFISGDPNINYRSNHWMVSGCTFSNVFNGIVCATNNRSEYGSILGNRMSVIYNVGIWLGGANNIVANNNINGYQDFAGGYGPAVSTGLRFWSDNGRGHSIIANNLFNHHGCGVDLRDAGAVTFLANAIGGCASNYMANCPDMMFSYNQCDTYSANGTRMVNCYTPTVIGNRFQGVVIGFNNYTGIGNVLSGYGPSTNDYVSAPRGATLGNTTITGDLTINDGAFGSSITASGIARANYVVAQSGFGFQGGPFWNTNNSPTKLSLADWNSLGTLRATETGGSIISRTNAWTASDLSVGQHATWNSNASGVIFMSVNIGGMVTNKLIAP